MVKKRGFPKIFFGWWMVLAGGFLTFWGMGYYIPGFSVLLKPLSAEFGFSRAQTSVPGSIGRFSGGLEAPLTGWLSDRFGPRRVMLFGICLFSLGLILMNFINSMWTFYVVWGILVGTGVNTGMSVPLQKAITNWFVKKRGLALSIRFMFSGLLVLPIITWLVTTYSWRIACLIGGLVMLCVGLPLVWFVIRQERPEYYGLLPDGATVEAEVEKDTEEMVDRGIEYAAEIQEVEFTLRQAMRTPAYWLLILAQFGSGTTIASLLMHSIPFLTDMGMSPTKAAATVTLTGLTSIAARLIGGILADRSKRGTLRFISAGALLLQAAGIAIFWLNQTMPMVYPFFILWNIGFGANMIVTQVIGGRYFGRKAFGSIRGFMTMITMPIGILGPIFAGWIYDTTGSYITAFTIFAALLAFAAVVISFARPPKPPAEVTDIRKIV